MKNDLIFTQGIEGPNMDIVRLESDCIIFRVTFCFFGERKFQWLKFIACRMLINNNLFLWKLITRWIFSRSHQIKTKLVINFLWIHYNSICYAISFRSMAKLTFANFFPHKYKNSSIKKFTNFSLGFLSPTDELIMLLCKKYTRRRAVMQPIYSYHEIK